MKVLVCGGREYFDRETVFESLDRLHAEYGFTAVMHGAARGADALADAWAKSRGVARHPYPAAWKRYGNAAGPIRNSLMLTQGKPGLVVAFPGHVGTADMIAKAKAAGVPVIEYP
jgi:ABC-type sugar transport system substrate-binding protein